MVGKPSVDFFIISPTRFAQQIKIRFDSIVKDVRLKMNVVAFNLAKMEIPELLTK